MSRSNIQAPLFTPNQWRVLVEAAELRLRLIEVPGLGLSPTHKRTLRAALAKLKSSPDAKRSGHETTKRKDRQRDHRAAR